MKWAEQNMINVQIVQQKIAETAHIITINLLSIKSRDTYERQYKPFGSWLDKTMQTIIPKTILLAFIFQNRQKLTISFSLDHIFNAKGTIQVS